MDPILATITLAAFVNDLVELGWKIKHSIDQVGKNKVQLSSLRDEVTETLNGLVKLTQRFDNAELSLELWTALEDLKSHLERIHNKSAKASQHTSWFKSWWNRQKIDQDIKRLIEFKKDCYEQFTLFSTARIEGKVDQIVDVAIRILDTTTETQATTIQMADTTTRIKVDTAQIMGTAAQIQTDIAQVASTSARIEDNTGFLTNTTSQIEWRTNEIQVSVIPLLTILTGGYVAPSKAPRYIHPPPSGMPRKAGNPAHASRAANGTFSSTHMSANNCLSDDDSASSTADETAWESDWEEGSEGEAELWESLPTPRTYEERIKRNDEKKAKAKAKQRMAEIRSAEHRLDGPMHDQRGAQRGPYGIGGLSTRSIQEKCKKLRDDFDKGIVKITEAQLQRQLAAIKAQGSTGTSGPKLKQTSISSMFAKAPSTKRSRPASVSSDSDIQEITNPVEVSLEPAPKCSKPDDNTAASSPAPSAPVSEEEKPSDESDIEDETEMSPEELEKEARLQHGDEIIDSIAVTDNIAEWIEVLEDAAPVGPESLHALAADCLKLARKKQDYRSTVLFAALVDFYRWMPRMGRLRAALRIAKNHGRGPAFQRVIAAQARFFEANGSLKPSHQGQRKVQKGLLNDEGFYMGVQRWLRTLEVGTAKPDMQEVLPELIPDDEDDVEHIVIVHDESTIHSNDYENNHYWLKPGEQVLKKKGHGRLIMISGFLCERYGLLALTDAMIAENEKLAAELCLAITDSTTVIYPDNKPGGDAYWNMEQMIAQLIKAILIARRMFPKAIIHWVFDNSSAHGSLAKDALTASKMNVNPGGKVPEMRDTIIPASNPHGHGGEIQKMTFDKNLPDNHPHKKFEGLPKGMKIILSERGYTKDSNGKSLIGDCKVCKASKSRKPHLDGASPDEEADMYGDYGNDSDEEDGRPVDCCMRRLLSLQPDFVGQKSQLELLIESTPGMRSNGTWKKAKELVAEVLRLCPLPTIRRFYRRADRYASVYRLGATGVIAEFAVKKYRGHHGIRAIELEAAGEEWKEKAKLRAI
ncbi:hypothetical protein DFH08DRAFT_1014352 [Mycena albidolilacea]|uniref:Uncharacterized protein n=1 Tax=Mycena albidolilacea TaxID=1033008 RepID=A0AAD6ZSS0_9AGAR|nr:hypothetical protein DFH08DRAFT_1014352 [Mycena albidolilacea]